MRSYLITTIGIVAAVLLNGSSAAWAQPSSQQNIVAATTLYNQATALADQQNFLEACPKLEEAIELWPEAVGLKIELGKCYEGQQRLASAWKMYRLAEASAAKTSPVNVQKLELARKSAERLEPTLSKLTILVPNAERSLSDLEIRCDGKVVDEKDWGRAIPVDGGKRLVSAKSTGNPAWETVVLIDPRDGQATVQVQILPVNPPVAPPAAVAPVAAVAGTTPPSMSFWSPQRYGGLGAAIAGVGVLAVGAGFGLDAAAKARQSREDGHCINGNQCDSTGFPLLDDAHAAGTAATVLFVAGGTVLAGGIVIFATARGAPASPTASLMVGPNAAMFRGTW